MRLGVVVARDGQVLADGAFPGPEIKIGRHPFSHVHLDNEAVSERHAIVQREDDTWVLRDLGSKNGLFADGRQVSTHVLNDGDEIETAGFVITFYLHRNLKRSEAPEVDAAAHAVFGQTMRAKSDHEQRERSSTVNGHLVHLSQRYVIDRDVLLIGGGEGCEVKFDRAPRIAAAIVRGPGGFSIVPADGPVQRNGTPVTTRAWLDDGDRLALAGRELLFKVGLPRDGEAVVPPTVPKAANPQVPPVPPTRLSRFLGAAKERLDSWKSAARSPSEDDPPA